VNEMMPPPSPTRNLAIINEIGFCNDSIASHQSAVFLVMSIAKQGYNSNLPEFCKDLC
jgi:hypothetical protein